VIAVAQSLYMPMNAWLIDSTLKEENIRFTNTFAKISVDAGIAITAIGVTHGLTFFGQEVTCGLLSTIGLVNSFFLYKNTHDNDYFINKKV